MAFTERAASAGRKIAVTAVNNSDALRIDSACGRSAATEHDRVTILTVPVSRGIPCETRVAGPVCAGGVRRRVRSTLAS